MRPLRTLPLVPLLALVALPLAGLGQDGGDPTDQEGQDGEEQAAEDEPTPLGVDAVRLPEKKRIEQEIEGAWLLTNYQSFTIPIDVANIQGFAQFRNGYATMIFEAIDPELEAPYVRRAYVQGGAHRYRITEFLTLQLATIMGFDSFNAKAEIALESSSFPREYRVQLEEDVLSLARTDGTTFWFTRLQESEFPLEALDALQSAKQGGR